jgi:hypothetical protein
MSAALIGGAAIIGFTGSPVAARHTGPAILDPPRHLSTYVTDQVCMVNQVCVAQPGGAKSAYEAITRYVRASRRTWPTTGWAIPKGEPYMQDFGINLFHDGVLPEVTVQKASDGTWTVTGIACDPSTAQ